MVIFYGVVAVMAAFFGYVATRPNSFRMERRVRINATPDRVFPHLSDFHKWTAWSPWENIDPALNRTYSVAASGPGAIYEWRGNRQVGEGRMEITDASAPNELTIKLDFLKPFEAHNTTQFSLAPSGGATDVTWAMHGESPFMSKMMGVFVDMDKLIGKDFEKGLASLKTVSEA
jgi:carbon monoxide dehydrogenase subunit G